MSGSLSEANFSINTIQQSRHSYGIDESQASRGRQNRWPHFRESLQVRSSQERNRQAINIMNDEELSIDDDSTKETDPTKLE